MFLMVLSSNLLLVLPADACMMPPEVPPVEAAIALLACLDHIVLCAQVDLLIPCAEIPRQKVPSLGGGM